MSDSSTTTDVDSAVAAKEPKLPNNYLDNFKIALDRLIKEGSICDKRQARETAVALMQSIVSNPDNILGRDKDEVISEFIFEIDKFLSRYRF